MTTGSLLTGLVKVNSDTLLPVLSEVVLQEWEVLRNSHLSLVMLKVLLKESLGMEPLYKKYDIFHFFHVDFFYVRVCVCFFFQLLPLFARTCYVSSTNYMLM